MLKATDHPLPGLQAPTRRGHPVLPTPQKAGSREASTSWPGRRGPASRGALSNTPLPHICARGRQVSPHSPLEEGKELVTRRWGEP